VGVRALALIDGEHYPPVVIDALRALGGRFTFVAAVFLGGTEKISGGEDDQTLSLRYGIPVHRGSAQGDGVETALERYRPDVVVDLSDEPVLGYRERFRLISIILARDIAYEGSDFRFTPPSFPRLSHAPSLSIVGTGKRVGKTAVSGYLTRTLQDHLPHPLWSPGVVVVAMGRGGPEVPEVIDGREARLTVADLLALHRSGRHASSDHVEDAALSGVVTVGCRRCGGGMAGGVFVSNVAEGARVANGLLPVLTVFEGSGAALPPVDTDARLLVVGAHQPREYITGLLGSYRLLVSDAVVVTMAEAPQAGPDELETLCRDIQGLRPGLPVVPVVFRPQAAKPARGRRVAYFSTARGHEAALSLHLEEREGCEVVMASGNLSDRPALLADLRSPALERADLVLTEIKAAAIDIVAEEAERRGLPVGFVDNVPVEVPPARPGDLRALALALADMAHERYGA
jgi:cyclic 2,3-diphosphoglycerate synthetase